MSGMKNIIVAVLVVAGTLLYFSVFTVHETERAMKFRLGEVVRADYEPGLHFKMPFINNVRKFDGRVQTLDAEPERFLTGEQKNLIVDTFVKWRIGSTREFYTTVRGSVEEANRRLGVRVRDRLRSEFGRRQVDDVIAGDRALIMDILQEELRDFAANIGVEVVDVRIKRVDLPPNVSESVFARMRADRERVARNIRAQGEEQAETLRAEADRQVTILVAEAERDAETIRGEGDARAAQIYADAFDQDREFFNFTRSLRAYQRAFDGEDDVMVLSPRSDFFRYFEDVEGRD
ncbi:membrane protease subunit HflC [Natronocella acetinitrilica]|uniref:Protein HflC n=1 Tax=Natronocella acetinitrilica TaxID=414046 RepID=A0AAE3G3A0_9GAMM|nr:protease modulator HflC [Natronocella acetinitrilica]MCP1675015.1 membrane protease subunit HflC [Natronocella acetinitrilica]